MGTTSSSVSGTSTSRSDSIGESIKVSGNSFVFTNRGILMVKDLKPYMKIWTSKGWVSQQTKLSKHSLPTVCLTFNDGSELIGSDPMVVFDNIVGPDVVRPVQSIANKRIFRYNKYRKTIGKYDAKTFIEGCQEVQGHMFGNIKMLQELQIRLRFSFRSNIVLNSTYELVKSNAKQYVINTRKMKSRKNYEIILDVDDCLVPVNNACLQCH